jgi:hypothetical protein
VRAIVEWFTLLPVFAARDKRLDTHGARNNSVFRI